MQGHYEVLIDSNYWSPHNTIWVHATLDSYQGDHKVEADAETGQVVDVSIAPAIPEFSVPVVAVLSCISVLIIVFGRCVAKDEHV